LKVTLQQFYLPDGQSTQREGVAADIVIPSIIAKMDIGEADLKYALEHDTVKAARHDLYSMVPADLLGTIRQRSVERVAKDDEFADLLRRVDLYVSQKERDTVSIQEEEFMARRKELDAQKEDEDEQLDQQIGSAVIYRDNYYNREVINIAHDYIEGLQKQNLAKAG
jgi:carboxyl-terminal processing protease